MKKDDNSMTHGEKCIMTAIIMCFCFHLLVFWFLQSYSNKNITNKLNEIIDNSSTQDYRRNTQYGILKKKIIEAGSKCYISDYKDI